MTSFLFVLLRGQSYRNENMKVNINDDHIHEKGEIDNNDTLSCL